jgi:hypothetical protein
MLTSPNSVDLQTALTNDRSVALEDGTRVKVRPRTELAGLPRKPNFLLIGAAKSGTTSFWYQLRQHPQIFMHPGKQLNFFTFPGDQVPFRGLPPLNPNLYAPRNWDEYCFEFRNAGTATAVGEASNSYLYSASAPDLIKSRLPDVRLIALLRHPAERAHSRFLQMVKLGREPLHDFEKALGAEERRIQEGWWPEFHYLAAGKYCEQLSRYFRLFPASRIMIVLHEDLATRPIEAFRDVFSFLEVDGRFVPDMTLQFSASGLARSKPIDFALKRLRMARPALQKMLPDPLFRSLLRVGAGLHHRNLKRPELSGGAREWLIQQYREDTLRLQELIQRDLSAWLT